MVLPSFIWDEVRKFYKGGQFFQKAVKRLKENCKIFENIENSINLEKYLITFLQEIGLSDPPP